MVKNRMKKNNFLEKLSMSIIILSFIYLGIKIYGLIFIWRRYYKPFDIFAGISREICDMLFIPLLGIIFSFSILFCNYWIKDRNENDLPKL